MYPIIQMQNPYKALQLLKRNDIIPFKFTPDKKQNT